MEKTKQKKETVKKPVFKDKLYELNINDTPIAYMLKSKGILIFDEETDILFSFR